MKVNKAVILCGGLGTRFLPITKAVPKEILPLIDTPVLDYIVREATQSGIKDILIVLSKGKQALKNYFVPDEKLETHLDKSGKKEFADILRQIGGGARISFVEQEAPRGMGDAVLYAEEFAAGEPFALASGDDLMYAKTPVMKQLVEAYEKTQKSVLGVQFCPGDDIVKYGVADIIKGSDKLHDCKGIVEKPPLERIPSRLASLGRYILTSDVFSAIKATPTGFGGELQLADAINAMCGEGKVCAFEFEGTRYDMGDKFGFVCATIDYALRSKEFGEKTKKYIKDICKNL